MMFFVHMGTRRNITLSESVGISTETANYVVDWEIFDSDLTFILSKHRRLSLRS